MVVDGVINCVNFDQVKDDIHQIVQDVNKFDYIQNMINWSNRLNRWKLNNLRQRSHIQLPCGPVYECKRHNSNQCTSCVHQNNVFPQNEWTLKWQCNTHKSPHF